MNHKVERVTKVIEYKHTLELSSEELNIIYRAVGHYPYTQAKREDVDTSAMSTLYEQLVEARKREKDA